MCISSCSPAGFQESVTMTHVSVHYSYHSGSNNLQQCCNTHTYLCLQFQACRVSGIGDNDARVRAPFLPQQQQRRQWRSAPTPPPRQPPPGSAAAQQPPATPDPASPPAGSAAGCLLRHQGAGRTHGVPVRVQGQDLGLGPLL